MAQEVFLGVVDRTGGIEIPWRGTHIYVEHKFEPGTNLLVTLEIGENTVCAETVKVELPTLEQFKRMREEFDADWARMEAIFRQSSMRQKVIMLRGLDQIMRRQSWRK